MIFPMFLFYHLFKAKNFEKLLSINEYVPHKLIQILNIYNYAKNY